MSTFFVMHQETEESNLVIWVYSHFSLCIHVARPKSLAFCAFLHERTLNLVFDWHFMIKYILLFCDVQVWRENLCKWKMRILKSNKCCPGKDIFSSLTMAPFKKTTDMISGSTQMYFKIVAFQNRRVTLWYEQSTTLEDATSWEPCPMFP